MRGLAARAVRLVITNPSTRATIKEHIDSIGGRRKMKPYSRVYVGRELTDWTMNGCPLPPPHPVKVLTLAHLVDVSGAKRFVETGTLAGSTSGMIAQIPGMHVDTIEITQHYYDKAMDALGDQKNVVQHLGDSADVLPRILKSLDEPAVFWLDAHFSGGLTGRSSKQTAIEDELLAIFAASPQKHIIVIDDVRCFNGRNDYPPMAFLIKDLQRRNPTYSTIVRYDMMIHAPTEIIEKLSATPFRLNSCSIVS